MSDATTLQPDAVVSDSVATVVAPPHAQQESQHPAVSHDEPHGLEPANPAAAPPRDWLARLPDYARSLLKIRVPLIVRLASKRMSIGEIVQLGPGAIVKFDKSCEEMLELNVGQSPIAVGEAVKVGDKFGLRITSLMGSRERFCTVALPEPIESEPRPAAS